MMVDGIALKYNFLYFTSDCHILPRFKVGPCFLFCSSISDRFLRLR